MSEDPAPAASEDPAPAVSEDPAPARRFRPGSPRTWAIVLGALAVLSFAALVPLTVLSSETGNGVIAAVIGAPCAVVGAVVARRQQANPLGWLFLAMGIGLFLSTDGGDYAQLAYHLGHRLPLAQAGLVLAQIWGPTLVLFGLAILLFPDGGLPSPRWRWPLRIYAVAYGALIVATAAAITIALRARPVSVDSTGGLTAVDHPAGWFNVVQGPLIVVVTGFSLVFIARQALSWRRSSGDRRQQLKWLASGAAVTTVCLILGSTFSTTGVPKSVLGAIGSVAWLGVAALPVSIGVAILRYRLYDIDRIISRTLAYAIVTGLLVGVYAGLVLAIGVLGFHGSAAVAAATLVAAALFAPLRRRVQHAVDRRFNRARYDAEQMVKQFAAKLQDAVDPDVVRADLAGVVQAALEPTHVSVWLGQ